MLFCSPPRHKQLSLAHLVQSFASDHGNLVAMPRTDNTDVPTKLLQTERPSYLLVVPHTSKDSQFRRPNQGTCQMTSVLWGTRRTREWLLLFTCWNTDWTRKNDGCHHLNVTQLQRSTGVWNKRKGRLHCTIVQHSAEVLVQQHNNALENLQNFLKGVQHKDLSLVSVRLKVGKTRQIILENFDLCFNFYFFVFLFFWRGYYPSFFWHGCSGSTSANRQTEKFCLTSPAFFWQTLVSLKKSWGKVFVTFGGKSGFLFVCLSLVGHTCTIVWATCKKPQNIKTHDNIFCLVRRTCPWWRRRQLRARAHSRRICAADERPIRILLKQRCRSVRTPWLSEVPLGPFDSDDRWVESALCEILPTAHHSSSVREGFWKWK